MSDKYYSPETEEFGIGFEYEWNDPNEDDVWSKAIADAEDCYHAVREITNIYGRNYRVKYLDREDIEECGWEWKDSTKIYDLYYDKETQKHSILYSKELKRMVITRFNRKRNIDETVFAGFVKNKSEFKRILKQVGITK